MDLLVIIRSVNERTESICIEKILDQGILPENVVIVKESPFANTLKKSFEIGVERNKKWTLCIDADVLLKSQSIVSIIEYADKQDNKTFEVQGYVLDKFIDGPRMAGNHLYRTEFLPIALEIWPIVKDEIRPEGSLLKLMASNGFPYVIYNEILGLHDFGQYYSDIYRKSFIQSRKHLHFTNLFVDTWKSDSKDKDYQVALRGFADGIANTDEVLVDKKNQVISNGFEQLFIEDKSVLEESEITLGDVDSIIEKWTPSEIYKKYGKLLETEFFYKEVSTKKSRFKFLKPINFIGYVLRKLGERIQQLSK